MDWNDLITIGAQGLNISPTAVVIVVVAGQTVGRAIPDNKKGVLGFIRKFAKVIGGYKTPDLRAVRDQVVTNAVALGIEPPLPLLDSQKPVN